MSDLKIRYLGLELKNPVIVGASNLVNNVDTVKELEKAGAAAIVYKSLFEEQMQLENLEMHQLQDEAMDRHAEMITPFPNVEHAGPKEHLYHFKKIKENAGIPVIASLNAVYKESWIELADKLAEAGADALELNFYAVPRNPDLENKDIEEQQLDILKTVVKTVSIPVSVKLSPFYANPLNLIKKMDQAGAKGFILFNRLFQPNIDINKESHVTEFNLSNENDYQLSLRFAGLLHGMIDADICANTGIYKGNDIIKLLLAGAGCVQVVSAIYKNKAQVISRMLEELDKWMSGKEYQNIT
jgi:dihydroorotate dehydrogenase (fumarate)